MGFKCLSHDLTLAQSCIFSGIFCCSPLLQHIHLCVTTCISWACIESEPPHREFETKAKTRKHHRRARATKERMERKKCPQNRSVFYGEKKQGTCNKLTLSLQPTRPSAHTRNVEFVWSWMAAAIMSH